MPEFAVKFVVTCGSCGADLGGWEVVVWASSSTRYARKIRVAPCQTCLDAASDAARAEAFDAGRAEGYGSGHSDGFREADESRDGGE